MHPLTPLLPMCKVLCWLLEPQFNNPGEPAEPWTRTKGVSKQQYELSATGRGEATPERGSQGPASTQAEAAGAGGEPSGSTPGSLLQSFQCWRPVEVPGIPGRKIYSAREMLSEVWKTGFFLSQRRPLALSSPETRHTAVEGWTEGHRPRLQNVTQDASPP